MNKRIYIKDWLALKPYNNAVFTDTYYLNVSNNVKVSITKSDFITAIYQYLDEDGINTLACFLTSYLEDIASSTNLWNAFVRIHKNLYQKPIPFFETEEYYENEINLPDVAFLTWYFFNTYQDEKFIGADNNFFLGLAKKVMEVFDEVFEYAPENKALVSFYTINETGFEFYEAKKLIGNILFKSYLFYPDTYFILRENELELTLKHKHDKNLITFLNENHSKLLHERKTFLLALGGNQWASEIIGKQHPLSLSFNNMSKRIQGFFLNKGKDENYVFLEHIASGKKFSLTQKSLERVDIFDKIDRIIFIGLVKWRDEWWFSGVFFDKPFDANLILNEKNSLLSRMAVNFLDFDNPKIFETLQIQLKAFLEFNNGSLIAFMKTSELDHFQELYLAFYKKSLKLTKKDEIETQNRALKDGFISPQNDNPNFSKFNSNALVFFNSKQGLEIAIDINSAFPLKENSFFLIDKSEEDFFHMLADESISKELVHYCIQNCSENLPYLKTEKGKLILQELDFLLRSWKKENYETYPSITLIGE